MGIVVDSSVVIAAERGKLNWNFFLSTWSGQEIFLSSITASELIHGIFRATTPELRARRIAFVEPILLSFPILAIDLVVARCHGELSAKLATAGTPVGTLDLLIAAAAIVAGHKLLTRDTRSFPRIPGLDFDIV